MITVIERQYSDADTGWNTYKEEFVVREDGTLDYRTTTPGNCQAGPWEKWRGEELAIREFLNLWAKEITPELTSLCRQVFAELKSIRTGY